MEKKSKKSLIIGITSLFLVTLVLLGLTYAYYRTRIIGNNSNDPSISVVSKNLEVRYQDGNATMNMEGLIEPGFEYKKIFSVKNTGDETLNFSIIIDNVVNEYNKATNERGTYYDWKYTLYSGTEKVDANIIKNGDITFDTTQVIVGSVSINTDETKQYLLVIEYKDLDVDQSLDMGSIFSLRVNIGDENKMTWDNAVEGTLLYELKYNNEITSPVTVPGEIPSGTTVTYKERTGVEEQMDLTADKSNKYCFFSTSVKFDSTSGTFSLDNPTLMSYGYWISIFLANSEGVYGGVNNTYFIETDFKSSEEAANFKTSGLKTINEMTAVSETTLSYKEKSAVAAIVSGSTEERTLSTTEDDYGTSYYFRGNVNNNYVNFSGMCWRIVRVQGDGTIKLVLADENGHCDDHSYSKNNTTTAFIDGNTTILNGYANDFSKDGEIYTLLNTWLSNKITNDNKKLLVDTTWCNDNSIYYEYFDEFGDSSQYYGAHGRILNKNNMSLSLKCDYSGINNTSSMKIISNIGLLTADEIAFSGFAENLAGSNSYLKENAEAGYWTMSPRFYSSMEGIYMYYVNNDYLSEEMADNWWDNPRGALRPMIAVRSNVLTTTNHDVATYGEPGTYTNPYVIS